MQPEPTIRPESTDDIPGIRAVVTEAFGRAGEADLVDALRATGALSVSAVATMGTAVVGHVAFSPITINDRHSALALAPVAVAPRFQRQGIGAALIRWGLIECQRLRCGVIVVLGEPAYYHRFGFVTSSMYGITCPFPVPEDAYMVLELSAGAAKYCGGMVRYRPEFDSV
jgi:putative acetyltransferase